MRPEKEEAALSLRLPTELMELIEYVADQRKEPVEEAVRSMLEEIVEIERIRRVSSKQSRLEQRALFGSREAKRAATDAWEAIMTAWRARRPKKAGSGLVVLAIEVAASRMEEIQYLADRHNLPVPIFAFGLINEIVDIMHERSMSDEEAALRRQSADPSLPREQRLAASRKALAVWQEELAAWRKVRTQGREHSAKSRRPRQGQPPR